MTIYIDLDDTAAHYTKAKNEHILANPTQPYPQSEYGFFANLEPIEGSIETIKWLMSEGHEVYFLTAPSIKNLLCYSDKAFWVKKYFGEEMLLRLIICADKSLLNGDYLIDDCAKGRGQDGFVGTFFHFGNSHNWASIRGYFEKLKSNAPEVSYIGVVG